MQSTSNHKVKSSFKITNLLMFSTCWVMPKSCKVKAYLATSNLPSIAFADVQALTQVALFFLPKIFVYLLFSTWTIWNGWSLYFDFQMWLIHMCHLNIASVPYYQSWKVSLDFYWKIMYEQSKKKLAEEFIRQL